MQDYSEWVTSTKKIAGHEIPVVSKPGLAHWDEVTPPTSLIAEHVRLKRSDRLLVMGTHHGAGAAKLSFQNSQGESWLVDQSCIALECARRTFEINHIPHGSISTRGTTLLPESKNLFDVAVIESPKGRTLNRRWLFEAFMLLRLQGELFLAGSNDLGIQSVSRDAADLFGNVSVLDYKKGARIIRLVKNSQLPAGLGWNTEPGIAPGSWITYSLVEAGRTLTIYNLPGVFAAKGLDDGTSLLLDQIGIPSASRILDAGCGSGVISLALAGRLISTGGSAAIDMVDCDLYAVASAQKNIIENQMPNLRAVPSDLLEAVEGSKYDLIVSNPPFHTGKETNYLISNALIQQSHRALVLGGRLVIVANKFIRYEKIIEQYFREVAVIAQNNRFHLISALK